MKEIISYFIQAYNWLDKLPCQVKTILIITLIGIFGMSIANTNIKQYFDKIHKEQKELVVQQENYLERVAPEVDELMDDFIKRDSCIDNVILLNYHNSLMSSNGLAYKNLTGISEKYRGLDNFPCIDYWQDLDYINYINEINKVNQNDYVIIDSDINNQVRFPNFWHKLKKCEAKYAVLYPIRGINGPVGILIVLYKETLPSIDLQYSHDKIYPSLHKLSILLDFNNVKKNYED